ncbi:MAG: hypothetical protein ACOVSW_13110 [Candidatus Kapaibacteriota bacterium]
MLHNTRFYEALRLFCLVVILSLTHISVSAQTLNIYSKGTATTVKASDVRSLKFDKKMTIQSATSTTVTSLEFGAIDSITVTAAQTTTTYKGSITKGVADSTWVQAVVTSCNGMFTLGRSGRVKDASGVSWVVPMAVERTLPSPESPTK